MIGWLKNLFKRKEPVGSAELQVGTAVITNADMIAKDIAAKPALNQDALERLYKLMMADSSGSGFYLGSTDRVLNAEPGHVEVPKGLTSAKQAQRAKEWRDHVVGAMVSSVKEATKPKKKRTRVPKKGGAA